jgi:hypothetical protein
MEKIGALWPFLKRLYRDRYARGILAGGAVFFLGDFLFDLGPMRHADWSAGDWLRHVFAYWAIWLIVAAVAASLWSPALRAGDIKTRSDA